jgi:hypothetical protein
VQVRARRTLYNLHHCRMRPFMTAPRMARLPS